MDFQEDGYHSGWYREIGYDELERLVRHALANRVSLDAVYERVQQARLLTRLQKAENGPGLTLEFESGRRRRSESGGGSDDESYAVFESLVNWEIDASGRLEAMRNARVAEERIEEVNYELTRTEIASRVVSLWIEIAVAKEKLAVVERLLQDARLQAELVANAFELGNASYLDLLDQRSYLTRLEQQEIVLKGSASVNKRFLEAFCGGSALDGLLAGESSLGMPSEWDDSVTTDGLLSTKPELISLHYELARREFALSEAVSNQWPRIEIGFDLLSEAASISDLFESRLSSLFASLTWDVWHGNANRLRIEYEESRITELLHLIESRAVDAVADVESAVLREHFARLNLERGQVLADLSGRRVEEAELRFINGADDYSRVLDANRETLQTQLTLVDWKREACLARLDLMRGIGWREARAEEEK